MAPSRASTISPSGSIPSCSIAASSKAWPRPGAFDALNPDRPSVHAAAETILAHAASAHDQRTSGQHGLFGGGAESGVAPIRLPRDARWTLAERMAAERDAFGFYFSAHPVDAQRHLLAAHKVRSFAELAALPAPADGGRSSSMMAGLIEGARWRVSAKGRPLPDGDDFRCQRPI